MTGQVVLITGASGGLGQTVTATFLDRGASVIGSARSISDADFAHPRFKAIPADLTSADGARSLIEQTVALHQRIDVLIHLMGAFAGGTPTEETSPSTWDRMISLNLTSAFHAISAALPSMKKAGYGRIIAVGSRNAIEPKPNLSAYNVAKAGLLALVKTVALETAAQGITANAVLPGTIDTPANRQAMPTADFTKWVQPTQLAETMLWLASPSAASISGTAIPVFAGDL